VKLYNENCFNIFSKIPYKSVDLILTDPPYGTTQCKWDSIIPFEPMWKELKRIIKDNGCIALFGSEPFSSYLRTSNIKWFKYDWYWKKEKGFGFLNSKKQPLRNIETISCFYNKQAKYFPQMEHGKPYYTKNKPKKQKGITNDYVEVITKSDGLRFPQHLISFTKETGLHPTQKPVALLEYLIKTYTNENDTVLDFTMGSGSTGVACKNINRQFIGIEMDKKYFDIAKNRIESILV
tara:strand:+ start:51 stop:758 length:708 start_codon:yes stop_codon:yes gene_type:complete